MKRTTLPPAPVFTVRDTLWDGETSKGPDGHPAIFATRDAAERWKSALVEDEISLAYECADPDVPWMRSPGEVAKEKATARFQVSEITPLT